jgi:hypothetical protein
MLFKYIGSKFKVNDITILSDGDVITVNEEKENEHDTIEGTSYTIVTKSIVNNTTGKEIPRDVYTKIYKHLKPLDVDAGDIDDEEPKSIDKVNHPSHYMWLKDKCGIEVIDITRHLDFDLGNAIKYILRSGHKSEAGYDDVSKTIEDLEKAVWYINDKIKMLNGN